MKKFLLLLLGALVITGAFLASQNAAADCNRRAMVTQTGQDDPQGIPCAGGNCPPGGFRDRQYFCEPNPDTDCVADPTAWVHHDWSYTCECIEGRCACLLHENYIYGGLKTVGC